MSRFIVYRHTCLKTNKCYIGWTSKSLNRRWLNHLRNASKMKSFALSSAIRKYGQVCWKHDVLQTCFNEDEAKSAECLWIKRFRSNERSFGYNMTPGGDGIRGVASWNKGQKLSIEYRQKLSQAHQGKSAFWNIGHNRNSKSVVQLTLNGAVVAVHKSVKRAELASGIPGSNIGRCARGIQQQTNGFVWKYV